MVGDLPLPLDDGGHAPGGPDVAGEAESRGAAPQEFGQDGLLLARELGRRAGRAAPREGLRPAGPGAGPPLADRSLGDAKRLGDGLLGPALLGQFIGAQAAALTPVFSVLRKKSFHAFFFGGRQEQL